MSEVLTDEELVSMAHSQGTSGGQIALGEFILKKYSDQMTPALKEFIEKVISAEYEKLAKSFDMPAEDVALRVVQLMEKSLS
jgi:uncharacterized protein YdbL (DUF1318 family)